MPHVLPEPGPLFKLPADRITRAAAEHWPGEPVTLGAHVPSVTGHVRRVHRAGRELFAKDSVLGLSLVSVLRGVAGDGGRVRAAQAAYATSLTSLLAREAAQLRALHAAGIRVGRCAGYRRGVLFTETVTGPSLLDLITKEPARTADLMTGAVRGLAALQSLAVAPRPTRHRSPSAASIRLSAGSYGISGRAYVARLGVDQLDDRTRCGVMAVLGTVVARLLKLRLTPDVGRRPRRHGRCTASATLAGRPVGYQPRRHAPVPRPRRPSEPYTQTRRTGRRYGHQAGLKARQHPAPGP